MFEIRKVKTSALMINLYCSVIARYEKGAKLESIGPWGRVGIALHEYQAIGNNNPRNKRGALIVCRASSLRA